MPLHVTLRLSGPGLHAAFSASLPDTPETRRLLQDTLSTLAALADPARASDPPIRLLERTNER